MDLQQGFNALVGGVGDSLKAGSAVAFDDLDQAIEGTDAMRAALHEGPRTKNPFQAGFDTLTYGTMGANPLTPLQEWAHRPGPAAQVPAASTPQIVHQLPQRHPALTTYYQKVATNPNPSPELQWYAGASNSVREPSNLNTNFPEQRRGGQQE